MGKQRKVIIHVGQSKAGSTSIQNYLEGQRDALIEQGFLFPKTGFSRKNPFDQSRTSGHLSLMRSLHTPLGQEFKKELERFPDHTVILSAENLFADLPNTLIREIGAYFETWQVEIIAVLRTQSDWVRSRYIENVMSGFIGRSETFDQFVHGVMEKQSLDYAARLEMLRVGLRATAVKALRFDGNGDALVRCFLEVAQLPITDMQAALSSQANRREKHFFLIEAKRRLNHMISGMTGNEYLELENAIRKEARAVIADSTAPFVQGFSDIPLSTAQRAHLWAGNQKVEKNGILSVALDLGIGLKKPATTRAEPNTNCEAAVEQMFWKGMEFAAEIAAGSDQTERFAATPLCFDKPDLAALGDLFAAHPVSAHVFSPETAILAAAGQGRLVRLFCPTGRASYREMARFDAMSLPSAPVTLPLTVSDEEVLHQTLKNVAIPQPGLVILGQQATPHVARAVMDALNPASLMFWGGSNAVLTTEMMRGFSCQQIGRFTILQRQHAVAV